MEKRISLVASAFRSLFNTLFGFIGFSIGLIALILFFAYLSEHADETKTSLKVLPNAEGEKEPLRSSGPVLLRIDIHDVIGLGKLKPESVELQLFDSRRGKLKDDRVKGILLHMNTPGGGVIESDDIYRALEAYKEKYKVPIYVYVDGLCASGGMYIASASSKIYASPVSIIGSVGVYEGPFFNFYDLMEKIGVKSLLVKEGKGKDALNPFRPWKEGEQQPLQEIAEAVYQRFLNILTEARPMLNKKALINEYGAKVFIAEEAQKLGYIDQADVSYNDALRALKMASGIKEGASYQVVRLVPPREIFNLSSASVLSWMKSFVMTSPKKSFEQPFYYLYQP